MWIINLFDINRSVLDRQMQRFSWTKSVSFNYMHDSIANSGVKPLSSNVALEPVRRLVKSKGCREVSVISYLDETSANSVSDRQYQLAGSR